VLQKTTRNFEKEVHMRDATAQRGCSEELRLAICSKSEPAPDPEATHARHVTVIRSHETRVKINQPFKLRFVVCLNCNHIFPWFSPQTPPVSGFLLPLLVLLDDILVRISSSLFFLLDDFMVSIVCVVTVDSHGPRLLARYVSDS
jgi:hypothetical protein